MSCESVTGSLLKQLSQILVNKVTVPSKFVSSCAVINWNDVRGKDGIWFQKKQ